MDNTIAILGNVTRKYSWFVKTFTQGGLLNDWKVMLLDYRSLTFPKIKKALLEVRPKYVFTHLTFHNIPNKPIPSALQMFSEIKQAGILPIHVCYDARNRDRWESSLSASFYSALVGTKEMARRGKVVWKIPTYYSTYSSLVYNDLGKYNPRLDFKVPLFTGNPDAHKDRSTFIQELAKTMPIKIIKTQSKEDLREQTLDLSASTPCILGLCTGYDLDGYIDVRPFQYLGAGACMIMRKFKHMDKYIPDDLYYGFNSYSNPQIVKELFMKLRMNAPNDKMRNRAFNYIQQNHSCGVRMRQILAVLDGKTDKIM